MNKTDILKRLNESIANKTPIIGVSIGNGRSAIQAASGGADIIATLSAGRFRMAGIASIACTLPFQNSNDLVLDYGSKEVIPKIDKVPVIFGACAQDPTYQKDELIDKLISEGYGGIINFPTVSLIDGNYRLMLEENGEGFDHEVNLIKKANQKGLFTVAFTVSMDEAIKMVNADADVLCLHFGWTYINEQPENELNIYVDRLINKANRIFDEAKKIKPSIITMIYGGTFVTNQKIIKRFYDETSTVGYFGGSVFDTFPLENNMRDATEGFKTMNRVSLLEKENERLKKLLKKREGIRSILGNSVEIQKLIVWMQKVSNHDSNILIEGESGTGKDLVIRAIHYNSERAIFPLKKVNCASIPKNLIESELFGHERGAFVGAEKRYIGLFESANHGTVFLDNVAELDLDIQAKLLRVIQDMELERLGGKDTIELDVRIVSTSSKDLKEEMLKGNFREDLYYLLTVLNRTIPPLREHKEDIPIYVSTFLEQISERHHLKISITDSVLSSFMNYNWPGNIRELKNVLERGVILCDSGNIDISCLPVSFHDVILLDDSVNYIKNSSMVIEKELIIGELIKGNWNQTKVAEKLGITRRTLYNKLKKYGISKKDYVG